MRRKPSSSDPEGGPEQAGWASGAAGGRVGCCTPGHIDRAVAPASPATAEARARAVALLEAVTVACGRLHAALPALEAPRVHPSGLRPACCGLAVLVVLDGRHAGDRVGCLLSAARHGTAWRGGTWRGAAWRGVARRRAWAWCRCGRGCGAWYRCEHVDWVALEVRPVLPIDLDGKLA